MDKEAEKKSPSNNKEVEKAKTTSTSTPKPIGYQLSLEGAKELADMINQLVIGKYAKQAFFNGVNSQLVPIFPEESKDVEEKTNKDS